MIVMPSIEEVELFFKAPTAQDIQCFIDKHPERLTNYLGKGWEEDTSEYLESYRLLFQCAYASTLEGGCSIDVLVEQFADVLGEPVLAINIDYENNNLHLRYDEKVYEWPVVYSFETSFPEALDEGFDLLTQLLADRYRFKIFINSENTSQMEFLLLPNEYWQRLYGQFGEQTISSQFIDYAGTIPLENWEDEL